jgi:4-amino-4-deoxy-L-arabinose transferase-like glycosyltransferase
MTSRISPSDPQLVPRWLVASLLLLIAGLFLGRNLPWHLDDYDQAKQAFVSFEMLETQQWWFQHTPSGKIATKPPLAGWISAGCSWILGGSSLPLAWPLAWRIPSLLSSTLLLALLWKWGSRLSLNPLGAIAAISAFALTVFTPRLASLVRTDMLLTASIVSAGLVILKNVGSGAPWTSRDRWLLFTALLASMLLKGPIALAFLLPGLTAYALLTRKFRLPNHSWSGAWPWYIPLLLFALWACLGISFNPEFYEQVVHREFLGRFQTGQNAVHQPRNPFFYAGLIALRWQPWSCILALLLSVKTVRNRFKEDPALLWLACWTLGGLLCMSLIPSKRFDRILPALPPLCLLITRMARFLPKDRFPLLKVRKWTLCAIALSATLSSVYCIEKIRWSFLHHQGALARFGATALSLAPSPSEIAVIRGGDEGLLLYTHQTHFLSEDQTARAWNEGKVSVVLLPSRVAEKMARLLPGSEKVAATGRIPEKTSSYVLLRRSSPSVPTMPRE